ncbi:hypothetical protein F0344_00520 [Streptomyces finlayi]|uniref:Uncharacterized protein n=1 Tax=Streptomyces finlayi TaxID=67296 RepID=A0A7G7BD92_9ACTN|nr:hypothetical protein [Streptomyces finlayi]QNE73307.1 hypothetical protein F0344_00520 [Streptomyces finlayi]
MLAAPQPVGSPASLRLRQSLDQEIPFARIFVMGVALTLDTQGDTGPAVLRNSSGAGRL